MPESVRRGTLDLASKLGLVATPFAVVAILLVSAGLWINWQLAGGAAAVNEAGRMRMQAWRLAFVTAAGDASRMTEYLGEFEASLGTLREGDPARPLMVPDDERLQLLFGRVEREWRQFRGLLGGPTESAALAASAHAFVGSIDDWVRAIENHLARWTALLHAVQLALLAIGSMGVLACVYTAYRFVLSPVTALTAATARVQSGDLTTRVRLKSGDEFAILGEGFNAMAERIESMYRNLEARVAEKTRELESKRARLEALYAVTTLVANATTLERLADGFVALMGRIAKAEGVILRWTDEQTQRYVILAAQGIPERMLSAERCLAAGSCHCAQPESTGARVIPIVEAGAELPHCVEAGFRSVLTLPVRHHDQVKGEVDLLFSTPYRLTDAERSLFDAITTHLAAAIENIRLTALERESAVAQERLFIARELHDSIAQSLAFAKLQVDMLRTARRRQDETAAGQAIDEIDTGLRECYADVRELLVHFRTRTESEQIEPALRTTLRKFEHQTGIRPTLRMAGHGVALPPDTQLQVLHIVQEALSNVRKHARASAVTVTVEQAPEWRFEIADDGIGFDPGAVPGADETHVGLRIMRERAERIGAVLDVASAPGAGTSVALVLPAPSALTFNARPQSTVDQAARLSLPEAA